jgi:hypothetical protein
MAERAQPMHSIRANGSARLLWHPMDKQPLRCSLVISAHHQHHRNRRRPTCHRFIQRDASLAVLSCQNSAVNPGRGRRSGWPASRLLVPTQVLAGNHGFHRGSVRAQASGTFNYLKKTITSAELYKFLPE